MQQQRRQHAAPPMTRSRERLNRRLLRRHPAAALGSSPWHWGAPPAAPLAQLARMRERRRLAWESLPGGRRCVRERPRCCTLPIHCLQVNHCRDHLLQTINTTLQWGLRRRQRSLPAAAQGCRPSPPHVLGLNGLARFAEAWLLLQLQLGERVAEATQTIADSLNSKCAWERSGGGREHVGLWRSH